MGNSLLWIPLLPLLGAIINLTVGKRLGRTGVHFVAVSVVAASFFVVLSQVLGPLWDAFVAHRSGQGEGVLEIKQVLYTWIEISRFKIELALRLDTLSAVMTLIITFVGTLIHIYSTGYMSHEPRYAAYFGYLNLFMASMLILVLGANIPVMFIGWEGVGLCSFLLIGFWFENESYANAGRKAFVVNRIGDFAFLLGMFLLYLATKDLGLAQSLDFVDLRSAGAVASYDQSWWGGQNLATAAGILLFIGACGKSAQIPLYVWLPDAMAGPTPVSALIHAATMVTAGIYMICRLSWLFAASPTALMVVATVGMLTALAAAFMAFAQNDLKKVLAYSTVSQLGFMFVAAGTGNWVAAIFHVGTHAFFKAGLFLGAGSVMHAMSGSGDIMQMGGLRKRLPITHLCFVIYCLAIAGFPLMSGFFSKDEILAGAWAAHLDGWPAWYGKVLWGGLTIAALGTAFYMWRLYFLVFAGKCRADEETKSHIHESPASMTGPLVVLAVLSVFAGFIGLPHLKSLHNLPGVFHGIATWLEPATKAGVVGHNSDGTTYALLATASVVGLVGIFLAWRLYGKGPSAFAEKFVAGSGARAYDLSKNKLYVDEIYEAVIIKPFRVIARGTFEIVDRFIIDFVAVTGLGVVAKAGGAAVRWVQNGQVQRYLLAVLIGGVAIFLIATRKDEPTFTYYIEGEHLVLEAKPGNGLAEVGNVYRWDIDNDGVADSEGTTPRFIVRPGDASADVTLWVESPATRKTYKVTRTLKLDPTALGAAKAAEPAHAAGGL